MTDLTRLLRLGWRVAARVDTLRGEVLDARHGDAADDADIDEDVLFAAIEMLRSKLRPTKLVLFTDDELHVYVRTSVPHTALVLLAPRSENIGLLLSELHSLQQTEEVS